MSPWTHLPHGPLTALADNLWRVEAPLPRSPLRRVMTVARRADGDLVVHSAISLSEEDMGRLDGLGPVRYLLVPNGYHRMDAPAYHRRYPQAKVLCPSATRKRVEAVVPVDGGYEAFPADEAVRLEMLAGTGDREGVMIVRSQDGVTVVLNDIVFNMPHAPGVSGLVLRYVTASTGGPLISRLARLALVKDGDAVAAHLLRLAQLPGLVRLIVSHHELSEGAAAAAALRQAVAR